MVVVGRATWPVRVSLAADAATAGKLATAVARVRKQLATAQAQVHDVSAIVAAQAGNAKIPDKVGRTAKQR